MACASRIRSVVCKRHERLPLGASTLEARVHEGPGDASSTSVGMHAEHPDVRFLGMEVRVVVGLDPRDELQRGAADDTLAVERHEHRRAAGAARDIGDRVEVLVPCMVVRAHELAIGLGRDPAGFLVLGHERLADDDRARRPVAHPTTLTPSARPMR